MLKRSGVPHEVLNAKYHEREAAIVAQAGRKGAVTVATNMAGRGTDIMLGGNPDFIADLELHGRGLSPVDTPEDYEAAWAEAVEKAKAAVAEEHVEVVEAGGLYVLGTERHESRRIDNQLRGRSGRQGDPGESRFYLSLEDDLMRMFNADKVAHFMEWLKTPPDVPIESKAVTRSIRSAQTQVEQQNFEIRKDVLKYDDVLNRQRQVIYGERRRVLEGADLHEQIREMIDEVIDGYVAGATSEGFPEEWDLDQLWNALRALYHPTLSIDDVVDEVGGERAGLSREFLTEILRANAQECYDKREEELTPEIMRELERRVVLSVLDRKWREHLYEMDYLREGIGLRAWAQRDPLVEYQREGYDMFSAMMDGIKEESVGNLFNLQVEVQENPIVEEAADAGAVASPAPPAALAGGGAPGSRDGNGARPGGSRGAQAERPSGGRSRAQARGRHSTPAQAAAPDAEVIADGAAPVVAPGLQRPQRPSRLQYTAPSADAPGQVEQRADKAAGEIQPGRPQRPVPVRVRPQVQALPRGSPQPRLTACPAASGGFDVGAEPASGPGLLPGRGVPRGQVLQPDGQGADPRPAAEYQRHLDHVRAGPERDDAAQAGALARGQHGPEALDPAPGPFRGPGGHLARRPRPGQRLHEHLGELARQRRAPAPSPRAGGRTALAAAGRSPPVAALRRAAAAAAPPLRPGRRSPRAARGTGGWLTVRHRRAGRYPGRRRAGRRPGRAAAAALGPGHGGRPPGRPVSDGGKGVLGMEPPGCQGHVSRACAGAGAPACSRCTGGRRQFCVARGAPGAPDRGSDGHAPAHPPRQAGRSRREGFTRSWSGRVRGPAGWRAAGNVAARP